MSHASRLLVLALVTPLLPACGEKTVELTGRVYSGIEQKAVADGATLEVMSFEEESLAQTSTDADGYFAVEVPMDVNVFLRLDHDGGPTTTFAGVVSLFDEELPDGYLYTVPDVDVEGVETLFAGCPVGSGKGLVAGEVRHQDARELDGSYAINTATQAKLLLEDGSEMLGCYLDDAGEGYAEGALLTGVTGRFAFLGVPAGSHTLELAYDASLQLESVQRYPVLVLDDPTVSPWFPAWVTLPN